MKKLICAIFGAALGLYAQQLPTFEDIGTLEALGADPYKNMQLCFPYIAFTDWDGDTKNDVILGGVTYPSNGGAVYLFKNSSPAAGTPTKFDAGVKMKAGGSDISLPSNWCQGACAPQVEDMNGDGLKDLIVGDYSGYLNMYTRKTDGTLNAKVQLKTASGPIQNKANWEDGIYAAITDWNNDGLKDMVVAFHHYGSGDITKCVTLFLNVGSATNPLFEEKGDILAGGKPINQFWFQCPQVADLNKDGKKDLLLGFSGWNGEQTNGTGYIHYFENSGTDAAPVLKAPVKLMLKNGTPIQDAGLKNLNNLCVVNWDNDGVWDLLVIHEKWTSRGEPQQPTLRILRGYVPGNAIEHAVPEHSTVSRPGLHISGTRVVLHNCADMSLSLYSVTGKLVRSYNKEELQTGSVQNDITGFAPGTYFYYFLKNEEKMSGGKFVIAR